MCQGINLKLHRKEQRRDQMSGTHALPKNQFNLELQKTSYHSLFRAIVDEYTGESTNLGLKYGLPAQKTSRGFELMLDGVLCVGFSLYSPLDR